MNVYSKPPPAGTEPVNSKQPGAGANGGVTKLMQECTVLLKAKMSYSSTSSSSSQQQMTPRSSDNFSFDAVGPVLESVLGGLTQVGGQGAQLCVNHPSGVGQAQRERRGHERNRLWSCSSQAAAVEVAPQVAHTPNPRVVQQQVTPCLLLHVPRRSTSAGCTPRTLRSLRPRRR